MTQADRQEGGCRCGRVRFSVTGHSLLTMACHCNSCQKMTASAFSVSALFHEAAFTVTQGETVLGGLRAEVQHHFCGYCLSWMFTRADFLGDLVNVRSILLDAPQAEAPFMETWTDTALSWTRTGARRSYPQFPDPADFPQLMADYAAETSEPRP